MSFDVATSVIPGTHSELSTGTIIYNMATLLWFLAVSFSYRVLEKRGIDVSKTFFVFHVIFSLLPLLTLVLPLRQLYFKNFRPDTLTIEDIGNFYNIYFYVGLFFLLGQVAFTAILLFRLVSRNNVKTSSTQHQL
jgi:hypothetical protein